MDLGNSLVENRSTAGWDGLNVRSTLIHANALLALWYAWRSARVLGGWIRVPKVELVTDGPLLSVVVPARDEERSIEACVRSLVAQLASMLK